MSIVGGIPLKNSVKLVFFGTVLNQLTFNYISFNKHL